MSVETSEFPGETVRVTARWNDRRIVLRLPDLSETDELTVGFAPEDAHVVAPE